MVRLTITWLRIPAGRRGYADRVALRAAPAEQTPGRSRSANRVDTTASPSDYHGQSQNLQPQGAHATATRTAS